MPITTTDIRRLPGLLHLLHSEVCRRSGGRGLQELHDLGLSMPQVIAMHVLLQTSDASRPETDGLGMHALGEALHLSPSAITTLVDKLVERHLVERWENPGDRRQKQVRLRPAGIELLDRMTRSRAAEFSEALADIDPALQIELLDVLQRVVNALGTPPQTV